MYLYSFVKFLHIIGLSVGYGGVLLAAMLSARGTMNESYFKAVSKIMPFISKVIWGGLILLFVSGAFLEETLEARDILGSGEAVIGIKKLLILLIVFHGIYVNLYLAKKMKILAEAEHPFAEPSFKKFKLLGIASTFVSLALWSVVVLLGVWATTGLVLK